MEIPEVAGQIVATTPKLSFWDMIFSADIIGQLVMLILVAASIISWAIIVGKYNKYKSIRRNII
jgi:biopolymer transport protein TolQ